jgi:glycosyltransferase involved in cell wall biosynthesis
MRIAQVAPLMERVPPRYYGGTERIVSYLTEELVRQGHEVTLFASADSITSAELVPCSRESLRLDATVRDPLAYYMIMLDRVRRRAGSFDVMHFHIDYLHFPLTRYMATPTITTLHGRLDLPDLQPLFTEFSDMPVASISDDQRKPLPMANWVATVPHGLPPTLHHYVDHDGGYLAFLGRISPEKRPDRAIEIARRAGLPLKIAAKVDKVDEDYFDAVVRPLLSGGDVEFIGEIGEAEKQRFLGDARALLFPIDWPEPFGLVTIEAMACGTPIVAWRCGSMPEIIDPGVTGFLVDSLDQAVEAVQRLETLDRVGVRIRFEQRFTVERMARRYLEVYRALKGEPVEREAA